MPVGLCAFALATLVFGKDCPVPSETLDCVGLLLSPDVATFLYGVSSIPGRGTVADRHLLISVVTDLVLIIAFVLLT